MRAGTVAVPVGGGGAFDAGRDLEGKAFYSACYAPSASMYFDQFGKVRACCQNTGGLLGDVTRQSIREIWESADAARLRSALAEGDLSVGCGFCAWQADEVGHSEFARGFDAWSPESSAPRWPKLMEFSMTNSCNLQCVMCNGDWSSSIRVHREHRDPLPVVYGEAFFEELEEFLPHLEEVKFLGGEPFLGSEPLRVMEMLARLDDPPRVTVTTNGTQWSPRIEAICDRLPMSFVVSLDGITKETYESIRVGSDFDLVMDNLARFQDHASRRGTNVSIAHCLMRSNYHEFADLLRFAEDRDLSDVGINTVLFPTHLSLFQMGAGELSMVIEELEREDGGTAAGLGRFRHVWDEQLNALRSRLDQLAGSPARGDVAPCSDLPVVPPIDPWAVLPLTEDSSGVATAGELVGAGAYVVRCGVVPDPSEAGEVLRPVLEADAEFEALVRRPAGWMVGRPMSVLLELLIERFGDPVEEPLIDPGVAISVDLMSTSRVRTTARARFVDEGATLKVIIEVQSDG